MSLTINSNMPASYSALNMKRANNLLTKSLQRLSSGKRIVSPADDAGGLAVGLKLQSSMRRAAASMMNTQNGVSFLQMQDGAMKVAGEIVDRMAELKAFFNDISKSETDRETYNHEFNELQKELNSIKSQKFNGVSLFASTDTNSLKIDTSDDGQGEKIGLHRTGFFENLKSKFGSDGILNSGSHGEYRQLVGSFTEDAGPTSANPDHTSRSYKSGEVVFKQGTSSATSGYFMALTDVEAGTKVEDSGGSSSLWIQLADQDGDGFSEAYPSAAEFDPFSLQRTSDGRAVSYLKGDVVRVPAHWDSAGSYFYLEAQTDVPYGKTLNELYNEGQVGEGKFFDYVGENSAGIPTTEFVRANSLLPDPSLFSPSDTTSFMNLFAAHQDNNYTPGHVKVSIGQDPFLLGGTSTVVNSSVQQVDTITGIAGGNQEGQVEITGLTGDLADAFDVQVIVDGQTINLTPIVSDATASNVSADIATAINALVDAEGNPYFTAVGAGTAVTIDGNAGTGSFSFTVTPQDNTADYLDSNAYITGQRANESNITYEFIANFFGNVSDLDALATAAAQNDLVFDTVTGTYWQAGAASDPNTFRKTESAVGLGDEWSDTGVSDLAALEALGGTSVTAQAGAFAEGVAAQTHQYLADQYSVTVAGATVSVDWNTDAATTAADLISAINDDASLSGTVTAALSGTSDITLTGIAPGTAFTATVSKTDGHNNSTATNPVLGTGGLGTNSAAIAIATTTAIPTTTSSASSSSSTAAYGVYIPASNWGLEQWDISSSWQAGDLVIDTTSQAIYEMDAAVKGTFIGQATESGDLVLYGGQWYQATGTNTGSDTPGVSGFWSAGVNPLTNGATDVTTNYTDLTNTSVWTRTHHGDLVGKTISTDYERGDNIYYQGKHYLYTSAIPSSEVIYNPDGNGYTEFEDLYDAGALVENPLYVDTVGGGGAPGLSNDIYYRPNQSLEYIDRLPDSGLVRTNSIERRSDSERYPGDEIFNSRDDQFYGGLNAGNDGIYGTMDDYYSTTAYSDTAKAGGHIDSDVDNNKDLLDESNNLEDFSVADFVDYIQTIANFRARNGGTMSRLGYASRILEENQINLQAATSRIMDADMAAESTRLAQQNVLVQASASMVVQANQQAGLVLSLLQ